MVEYNNPYKQKINIVPRSEVIRARSEKEAKAQFASMMNGDDDSNLKWFQADSDSHNSHRVVQSEVNSIFVENNVKQHDEKEMKMKSVYPVRYEFIPSDEQHLKEDGFCVIDQISSIYGPLLKKLSKDNFIQQCRATEKSIDDVETGNEWKVEDGVRVATLNTILKKHNISYYCFDITNKCFDKFVTSIRNYPPLVYYAVNNHMYWISNQEKALSLIRKQTEIDFKINSPMIQQHDEIKNMYVDDEGKIKHIYENIPIGELGNPMYNNSIVFFIIMKSNLMITPFK